MTDRRLFYDKARGLRFYFDQHSRICSVWKEDQQLDAFIVYGGYDRDLAYQRDGIPYPDETIWDGIHEWTTTNYYKGVK